MRTWEYAVVHVQPGHFVCARVVEDVCVCVCVCMSVHPVHDHSTFQLMCTYLGRKVHIKYMIGQQSSNAAHQDYMQAMHPWYVVFVALLRSAR